MKNSNIINYLIADNEKKERQAECTHNAYKKLQVYSFIVTILLILFIVKIETLKLIGILIFITIMSLLYFAFKD